MSAHSWWGSIIEWFGK